MRYIFLILSLFSLSCSDAQISRRPTRVVPYDILSNIELIIDASGLETNTNNDYGTVDGSNVITAIKSLAPGPTGRDFSVVGSGVTYDPTTKSIAFNGSGRLRSGSAASTWSFMNYNATLANLDYTVFIVVKCGNSFRPSATYGLMGTDGTSSASIGMSIQYGNSSASSVDQLTHRITRGTAANFIGLNSVNNSMPSDEYFVVTSVVDMGSGSTSNKIRMFSGEQTLFFPGTTQNNTTPQSTPTNTLEIGGAGNSIIPLTGNIKEVIIVREAVDDTRRAQIERALVNKHGVIKSDDTFVNKSNVFSSIQLITSTVYYFNAAIGQDPTSKFDMVSVYTQGAAHVYDAAKKLVARSSTDKGRTWSSATDIFDPSGAEAPQDGGGGFDHNGRFSYIVDTMTGTGTGQTHKVYQIYTDNNGSSWTTVDITSAMPSNGLLTWRMYGGMIVNDGVWIKPFYMLEEEGVTTNTGVYILRSTDGTTWTSVEVKAPSATYINEGWVVALDDDNLIMICRNEATLEWQQYSSTDNGLTWSDDGGITFGETITSANPLCLKAFTHKGQRVIVAYYPDRNNDVLKAVYALPANLISSGTSGWDLDTKFIIWRSSEANKHMHYGDVSHLDGLFNAIGLFPVDPYPGSGSGTINQIDYFTVPSWQLEKIETELGL